MKVNESSSNGAPPLVALNLFCAQSGVSQVTAWRWRNLGWLKTININGRVYLTAEAIAEFKMRAEAGEFQKEHAVPQRNTAVAA